MFVLTAVSMLFIHKQPIFVYKLKLAYLHLYIRYNKLKTTEHEAKILIKPAKPCT